MQWLCRRCRRRHVGGSCVDACNATPDRLRFVGFARVFKPPPSSGGFPEIAVIHIPFHVFQLYFRNTSMAVSRHFSVLRSCIYHTTVTTARRATCRTVTLAPGGLSARLRRPPPPFFSFAFTLVSRFFSFSGAKVRRVHMYQLCNYIVHTYNYCIVLA